MAVDLIDKEFLVDKKFISPVSLLSFAHGPGSDIPKEQETVIGIQQMVLRKSWVISVRRTWGDCPSDPVHIPGGAAGKTGYIIKSWKDY